MNSETDGRADFDFLDGKWKILARRLAARLQGSTEWHPFNATKNVHPVLAGIGHIDQFAAIAPDGRTTEAMTLRIFNPATRLWSLYWVDNRACQLDPPVVGRFQDGRGEFFGNDVCDEKAVRVRICWNDITATSARMEQSFSVDGGKTWEPNLQMALTREG